jgi:hypothetical protein
MPDEVSKTIEMMKFFLLDKKFSEIQNYGKIADPDSSSNKEVRFDVETGILSYRTLEYDTRLEKFKTNVNPEE